MALMTWKADYSVNIKQIDDQHKKLIELINTLHDAMAQGRAKEALQRVLQELVTYCATHFKFEEQLMESNGYPDFAAHKDKHTKMTGKVLALQKEVEAGKVAVSMDVMRFLEQWLDKHILGTDKKYGSFLNSKGVN